MLARTLISAVSLGLASLAVAQTSLGQIETKTSEPQKATLMKLVLDAKSKPQLTTQTEFLAMMAKPIGGKFDLAAPSTKKLSPREIQRVGKAGLVQLGWVYLCPNCNNWHLNLAAAYAVAEGGVIATCHHVVEPPEGMKSGYLVGMNAAGELLKVKEVIFSNATLDLAVLRVDDKGLRPLGLAVDAQPGDEAFLFSDPLSLKGYFSRGIINRFIWSDDKPGNLTTVPGMASLRVQLSTDWAPGSSGAPILNEFGNVIGHVTTISAQAADRQPMFWTHEAVPALGVRLAVGR